MKFSNDDLFEIAALLFKLETGLMRPGKDESPAYSTPFNTRATAWTIWSGFRLEYTVKVVRALEQLYPEP